MCNIKSNAVISPYVWEDFLNRLPKELKDCSTSTSFENKLERIEVCKLQWKILSNSLVSSLVCNSWLLRFLFYFIIYFFWAPWVDYREILSATLNKKSFIVIIIFIIIIVIIIIIIIIIIMCNPVNVDSLLSYTRFFFLFSVLFCSLLFFN